MNELELFTASLKDLGLTKDERIKRIKEWKISNKPLDVKEEKPVDIKIQTDDQKVTEQSTEVKIDDDKKAKTKVSTSADSTVETVKDTESNSETALSGLSFDPVPEKPKEYNNTYVAEAGEVFDYGDGAYKYEIKEDNKPSFYAKALGSDDWVDTAGDGLATMLVAARLGFVDDFDIEPYLLAEINSTDNNVDTTNLEDPDNIQVIDGEFEGIVTEELEEINLFAPNREGDTKENKKQRQDYKTYIQNTGVTFKETLAIEQEVAAIDLNSREETFNTGGGGSSMTGYTPARTVTRTVVPFEEERIQATEILQEQKAKSNSKDPITNEQIEGLTRLIISRKRVAEIKDQRNLDYLKNVSEEDRIKNYNFAHNIDSTFDPEIEEIKLVEEYEALKNSDLSKTVAVMSSELETTYSSLIEVQDKIREKQNIGINTLEDQE